MASPTKKQSSKVTARATKASINPKCPPGMEPLLTTSAIVVRKLEEMIEVFIGFDTSKRYEVLDDKGNRMFLAGEKTNALRVGMKSHRPFTLLILEGHGKLCLEIERKSWNTKVTTSSLANIGKIKQEFVGSSFTVFNNSDKPVMHIRGQNCCQSSADFIVKDKEGKKIGAINKKWEGLQEEPGKGIAFGVNFPKEMDVRLKTLMLAAVFLIDFTYFE